jgi:hypothetical protein
MEDLYPRDDPDALCEAVRAVARATALATCTDEVLQRTADLIGRAADLIAASADPDDWVSQVRAQTAVVGVESAREAAAAVFEHIAAAAASLASAAGMMGEFVTEHDQAREELPVLWRTRPGAA